MKKIVLWLSIILILLTIPATIFLVFQRQELRKKAAPATTLTLIPASVTQKVGDTFSLEVTIDTGENQVVAAEIHLVYDPAKLEAQSITNSALFPNILASGVVDRGTASITVGASDVKKPIKGKGTVAVVRLKALEKTDAPASVRFAPNTFVGSLGEGATNVIVGTTPATISITADALAPADAKTATPSGFLPAFLPTPTLAATGSAQASPSAIQILTPLPNSVSSTTPTIQGKAAPGATVTLTIYSTPMTVVVTADNKGNFSYTPNTPLAAGPHNLVASTTDSTGKIQTATASFVVAAGGAAAATQSAVPIAGTISPTYLLLAAGVFLILLGALTPVFTR